MKMIKILCWGVILVFFLKCKYVQTIENPYNQSVIAKVEDKKLYQKDLDEIIPKHISKEDSIFFAKKIINDWIKKQLIIKKAEEAISYDQVKIRKKVLDYQYALVSHEYEKIYINKNINLEVSEKEITNYYKENTDNFILRNHLVKCIYIKVPTNVPNIYVLKRNLKNYRRKIENIKDYTHQFATKTFLEDSIWIKFDEVIAEVPLKGVSNKKDFLKTNKYIEISDKKFTYFLKILEYKLIGGIAPLEFVKKEIKSIIINKRKIFLKKKLEKNIYEEAKKANKFVIYNH